MKGIIFTTDLIPKVLDGSKTMTRRIEAGLKEINTTPDNWEYHCFEEGYAHFFDKNEYNGLLDMWGKPRYKLNEVVYIKEAYQYRQAGIGIVYRSVDDSRSKIVDNKWRSPYYMREAESQGYIKITDIRAERLQSITEEDCIKEGITFDLPHYGVCALKDIFEQTWNRLHGSKAYNLNPWLFVYTFERTE